MRQNISQSEIGTGDTKLLVELHNNVKVWQINSFHLADNLANTLATLLEKQKKLVSVNGIHGHASGVIMECGLSFRK